MNQELQKELKSLRMIYIFLMVGVVFFIVISMVPNIQMEESMAGDEQMFNIFMLVSNLLGIGSILGGILVFKRKISNLNHLDLTEKLAKYREALIIRAATMEAPAFFFLVCNLLFGHILFPLEAALVVLIMGLFFPSNARIANELQIDESELE